MQTVLCLVKNYVKQHFWGISSFLLLQRGTQFEATYAERETEGARRHIFVIIDALTMPGGGLKHSFLSCYFTYVLCRLLGHFFVETTTRIIMDSHNFLYVLLKCPAQAKLFP